MTTAKSVSYRNRRNTMRKTPRSSVRMECRHGATGMGKNLVTQVLDLSEGGARLVLTEPLAAKEEVEVLIFGVSQTKPIKRLANACWSLALEAGNYCIGLEFQKKLLFTEVALNARP
jgi:hypothetical protein